MTQLKADLQLTRSEVLMGEALPMRLVLSNRGTTAAPVPNPLAPSSLEYVIRTAGDGGIFTVLSMNNARQRSSVDPIKLVSPPPKDLQPGEEKTYNLDPSAFVIDQIPTGNYTIAVAFDEGAGRTESVEVPLRILAPRAQHTSFIPRLDPDSMAIAFVHNQFRQGSALLATMTSKYSPRSFVFHRLLETQAPSMVDGIAQAIDFEPTLGKTWLAWLLDGAIHAAVFNGSKLNESKASVPIPMDNLVLHPTGYRISPETAWFALSGKVDGIESLALVRCIADQSPKIIPVKLALNEPVMPNQVGLLTGGTNPIWIVLVPDFDGNSTRISARLISQDGTEKDSPVQLIEHSGAITAMQVARIPGAGAVADVLFESDDPGGKYILERIALDSPGKTVGTWNIPMPELTDGPVPPRWILGSPNFSKPAVLVHHGDLIYSYQAGNWQVIADHSRTAQHLHLEEMEGYIWSYWFDRTTGLKIGYLP